MHLNSNFFQRTALALILFNCLDTARSEVELLSKSIVDPRIEICNFCSMSHAERKLCNVPSGPRHKIMHLFGANVHPVWKGWGVERSHTVRGIKFAETY